MTSWRVTAHYLSLRDSWMSQDSGLQKECRISISREVLRSLLPSSKKTLTTCKNLKLNCKFSFEVEYTRDRTIFIFYIFYIAILYYFIWRKFVSIM
jgi:hypothetical protein